jgi:hypothetical protein
VTKVALGQVFLLIVGFYTVFSVPPMFYSVIIIPLLLNAALIRRKSGRGQGKVRPSNVLSIIGGEPDIKVTSGKTK